MIDQCLLASWLLSLMLPAYLFFFCSCLGLLFSHFKPQQSRQGRQNPHWTKSHKQPNLQCPTPASSAKPSTDAHNRTYSSAIGPAQTTTGGPPQTAVLQRSPIPHKISLHPLSADLTCSSGSWSTAGLRGCAAARRGFSRSGQTKPPEPTKKRRYGGA